MLVTKSFASILEIFYLVIITISIEKLFFSFYKFVIYKSKEKFLFHEVRIQIAHKHVSNLSDKYLKSSFLFSYVVSSGKNWNINLLHNLDNFFFCFLVLIVFCSFYSSIKACSLLLLTTTTYLCDYSIIRFSGISYRNSLESCSQLNW